MKFINWEWKGNFKTRYERRL